MKKYIKINISLWDRLKLLFFGLIPEENLPQIEKIKEVPVTKEIIKEYYQGPSKENKEKNGINKEEVLSIPFFGLDDEVDDSNL